jgi:hypothetical protein
MGLDRLARGEDVSGTFWNEEYDPKLGQSSEPSEFRTAPSYVALGLFAWGEGFTVTFDKGGKHNTGSKHPLGGAVDIRTHKTIRVVEKGQIKDYPKQKWQDTY